MTSVVRAILAAIALASCLAPPLHAQSAGTGRLDGVVTDSVHARPLAEVRVQAVGVESPGTMRGEATTGTDGTFHIDSLVPGRYMVGFESALLDSLEIAVPPREVTIAAGQAASVELAMPPATKLRAALCPGVALPPGTGVVYGHVVSAETESPLAGVLVAFQWRELAFDRKTMRTDNAERAASVATDAGGWYRACGVPTGAWVVMQLQHEGRVGPALRALVDDTLGIAIRHLSFSESSARDTADVAGAALAPLTGTATLAGTVRGPGGQPVPQADVRVRGARSAALTDEQGSYTLGGLPAGTHELEVRRIGYGLVVATVELRGGATARRDVQMQRIVNLDSVQVVATRTRYPTFYEHQRMAVFGRFLGPADIMRRHAVQTSDLVMMRGGFIIDRSRGRSRVINARGASLHPCVANVVIDGMSLGGMGADIVSVDDVHPSEVGAMELYREGDFGPPEYDYGCGAIVIWTKR